MPKKACTKQLDFRPINLIIRLYKIIAQVLLGRLRGVLHDAIHIILEAFAQGEQNLDVVLIADK